MAKSGGIVLYVEDEEFDRLLMERAFAKAGLVGALKTVNDGQAAVNYLSGSGQYGDRQKYPLPQLVLLDLNLPEMHGFEVLEWIRVQPALTQLTVVIFSSSERDEDQVRARTLGADEFLKKPGSGLVFADIVKQLNDRWLAR